MTRYGDLDRVELDLRPGPQCGLCLTGSPCQSELHTRCERLPELQRIIRNFQPRTRIDPDDTATGRARPPYRIPVDRSTPGGGSLPAAEELLRHYLTAQSQGEALGLILTPGKHGRLAAGVIRRLGEFRQLLDQSFAAVAIREKLPLFNGAAMLEFCEPRDFAMAKLVIPAAGGDFSGELSCRIAGVWKKLFSCGPDSGTRRLIRFPAVRADALLLKGTFATSPRSEADFPKATEIGGPPPVVRTVELTLYRESETLRLPGGTARLAGNLNQR